MKQRVIALGFFDGVHLGHGALLRRTVEAARRRGCTPAVFTFDRPPKEVVTGIPCPLINSPAARKDLLRRLYGITDVLMVPFDREMMTTPWDRFVTDILVERYHAVHLVAGHDHHFGHKNQGSPELLAEKCAELGLGCDIIPKVELGGITVSSTYIRTLCHDIGQALGCGGTMAALRRTMACGYGLEQAVTLGAAQQQGESLLLPVDSLFARYPEYRIPSAGKENRVRNGNAITDSRLADGLYRVYGADGAFLCLSRAEGGTLTAVKNFFGG